MPRQRHGIRGDVGIAPYAPSTEGPCVTFGRTEPSAPTHAYRTRTLSLSCHSEPVLAAKQVPLGCTLAWESVPPRPLPLPLGEVAERSEDGEGKQRRAALRRPFFIRNLK